ncbi:MAG: choice-of-anchor D domain-containing protein [Thioploca sp.]|nr:choice-of-anchor D domain-containing protein [Thioploca sp.]
MNSYSFSLVLKRSIFAIALFALSPLGWSATDCDAVTDIPKEECQALLDLYNSTQGPNWGNKTGWNETDTPCSWYGIKCDNGQVYSLELPENKLSGTLSNSLEKLSLLDSLYLSGNQLTGPIPESLGNLSNLYILALSGNQLTGSIPSSLGNLSNLETLALHSNQLTGPIPKSLGNLSNLVGLNLSNNQLCGDIPNTISSLQLIEGDNCRLSNNYLTATDPTLIQFLDANCKGWEDQNSPLDSCPTDSHYTLTLEKTGEGMITATGIDCGSDCSEEYPANSTLTLTTQAAPNFEFIQWGGDCGDNFELELTLQITKNLNCTALFETRSFPEHTITLNKTGSGNGTLSLTVNNQTTTCQPNCTQTVAHQSQITLQAIPDSISSFVGFFGQGCGSSLFLTEDRVCEARFEPLPYYTLTITKSGQGSGRVTSDVGQLDCGDRCIRSYLSGTTVTLTAIPDPGSTFLAWNQDCSGATTKASISLYDKKTCTAEFGIAGTPQLTLDQSLIDFVQTNKLAKHTLTITNTGKGGLRIESLELADTSIFQINKDNCANNVLIPAGSCTVTLQFQPPAATIAAYQTQLQISSNDPQSPTTVDLQGQSCSPNAIAHRSLTANPYRLDFGVEVVGNRLSRQQRFDMWTTGCTSLDLDTLTLKGRHAEEFSILDKQCYYGHWQEQAHASCLFTVEFHPTSAGIKEVRPVITYTDPDVPMPTYYWSAQAVSEGEPQLELSEAEHDFGTLTIGKAIPSWTLTLTNRGTTNLIFTRIQLDSTEFKVYDSYCTFLVPQQSCSLLVQLTPMTLGDKSAQLSLTYHETTVQVPLTANITGPADCSPEKITIETSGQSPWWEDPTAWQRLQPGAELPGTADVVHIKSAHAIVGLPLIQVKALCIDDNAVLLSRDNQGSALEIQATDYFQNQGYVLGLDGADSDTETCTTDCAKPGASIIIKVGSQLQRQDKMGDWWWYGDGGPIVNLGQIQAGNGGSSENYGAPGGDALVLGRNTTNQGVIQAGQGGHVLGTGAGQAGRGGLTQIWGKLGGPGHLYNQNGAKALAGDGGHCNPAATEQQTGGDGGNLWLVSLPDVYLNNGIYRAGKGSPYCQPPGKDGFVQIEPSVIDLTGAQTHISGGNVTIFGGNDWLLDLSNMANPFLEATGQITLAVGSGGIIDLRHNQTPIMTANGQVNLFADTILIDAGVTLSDLITATAIVVGPHKILPDVNLVSIGNLFGQPQTTLRLSFILFNNGPQMDTYLVTLTNAAGWPLNLGESQITVAGLDSIVVTPQLTLPQELGASNAITMTVISQTDPRVQATAQVDVMVTDQPPLVTTATLPTWLAEKSITGITTPLDTVSELLTDTATADLPTEEKNGSSIVNLTPANGSLDSDPFNNIGVTETPLDLVEIPAPLTIEPTIFLSNLPNNTCPLNTDFINWPCDNHHQTLQAVTFGPQASVAGGLLQDHIENQGWISQVTIAPAAQVHGGKLTGDIINQGTLIDIQFVGRTVTGGTLQGVIDNQSQIGGTFIDVKLAANTVLHGGAIAGQISGDCQAPARLEHLIIQPQSQLKCVILGEGVVLPAEVILQDVQIAVSPSALSSNDTTDVVTLPHLEATIFDGQMQSSSTPALLAGGISINGDSFQQHTEMTETDLVKLYGQIQVDPSHIGQPGEMLVYGHYEPTAVAMKPVDFMLVRDKLTGKSQVKAWNGDLAKLEAFEPLAALPAVYLAPLYEDFLKVAAGQVTVFMGYQTMTSPGSKIVVQNQNGIELVIREREK